MDLRIAAGLHREGRLDDAERAYRLVLAAAPGDAHAMHLLGILLGQAGRTAESLQWLHAAAKVSPNSAEVLGNLAAALGRAGRHAEAADLLRRLAAIEPDSAAIQGNLGVALEKTGKLAEAAAAYRRAIALQPAYAEAHNHLGSALRALGRLSEAEAAHRKAIQLKPDYAQAYNNLAATLGKQGMAIEAIECHRQVVRLSPASAPAGSDLLFMLHYDPDVTRQQLLDEARRWAQAHAEPLTRVAIRNGTDRDRNRPLRIGYMSADFYEHPVARLMEPVLANLVQREFHTFCYSDVRRPDAVTDSLRRAAGTWREAIAMTDAQLADVVRADRIDILVDLAGHMSGNRLLAFARKPAPVQVAHFNYPDTTGMTAMRWRLTDALAEPTGEADRYSTERLYRLPSCAWVYQRPDRSADPGPLPALERGYVTFAALNRPEKHSSRVISLWAKITARVPRSRLMLLGTESANAAAPDVTADNEHVRAAFAAHGVAADRLCFVPRCPRVEYLDLYRAADIALDPFPYNGAVTSCDAMSRGVPVIALQGDTYVSRQGVMLLTNVGMPELIARDEEHYAAIAWELAGDLPRLQSIRSRLPGQFTACPVADGVTFTRHLETAYRRMWQEWCDSH